MKDYKTLTREKVDADPGAARYMGETHLLEDWSDKLLDLVLNGPTLNGFKNGRHYRIFISRGNGHRTVVVRTEEGLLRCPYYSMMSVLQYWKIIEIGW